MPRKLDSAYFQRIISSFLTKHGRKTTKIKAMAAARWHISFHGLSYKDQKIRVAYREAKAYLDKTDEPIEVTLLSD